MTNPNVIRVVAAVLDTRALTLYKEDGTTLIIPQGDSRVAKIVHKVTPICASGGVAEIDISTENHYVALEKQSGGLIKMFRVARNKLAEFFATEDMAVVVAPMAVGNIPPVQPTAPLWIETRVASTKPTHVEKLQSATQEIMKHAIPVSEATFTEADLHTTDDHQKETDGGDTVIAIVNGKILPDAHKLKAQMQHATSQNNSVGLADFIERCATHKRKHTLEELMRFMQRGDLPIADDGSIVIYKILKKRVLDNHKGFTYVDCHSGNVPQSVGSYVYMDESLVDPDRGEECSNGLHVARRGYLGNFSGDVVVIAKVCPEDVIAVPQYDSNKMRVCGYHILFELGNDDFSLLKKNQPIASTLGKQMLAKAISGDHGRPTTYVKIGDARGGKVSVIHKDHTEKTEAVQMDKILPDTPMATAIQAEEDYMAPSVDPKAVSQDVQSAKQGVPTRAEQAQALYATFKALPKGAEKKAAADAVLAFKKAKKVGWDSLGITTKEAATLLK